MTDKTNKQPKTSKKQQELEQKINDLTIDLQRTRADFENYRKRSELEKSQARDSGRAATIIKLLPVIDNIERAIIHAPSDIADHAWVQGVVGLIKHLDKSLGDLNLKRIDAKKGHDFNPDMHEAIQFDDDAEGDHEIIESELQSGYALDGIVIRPAMVKVTRETKK